MAGFTGTVPSRTTQPMMTYSRKPQATTVMPRMDTMAKPAAIATVGSAGMNSVQIGNGTTHVPLAGAAVHTILQRTAKAEGIKARLTSSFT